MQAAASAEACVAEADVVVTITKSATPVCFARWLRDGVHVNAAGANSGDRREIDAETVMRAAVKVTDHLEQAKVEAGEFRDSTAAGKLAWSDIRELGELVTGKAAGRNSRSDLTLFKSLGIALEDVAFGELDLSARSRHRHRPAADVATRRLRRAGSCARAPSRRAGASCDA